MAAPIGKKVGPARRVEEQRETHHLQSKASSTPCPSYRRPCQPRSRRRDRRRRPPGRHSGRRRARPAAARPASSRCLRRSWRCRRRGRRRTFGDRRRCCSRTRVGSGDFPRPSLRQPPSASRPGVVPAIRAWSSGWGVRGRSARLALGDQWSLGKWARDVRKEGSRLGQRGGVGRSVGGGGTREAERSDTNTPWETKPQGWQFAQLPSHRSPGLTSSDCKPGTEGCEGDREGSRRNEGGSTHTSANNFGSRHGEWESGGEPAECCRHLCFSLARNAL